MGVVVRHTARVVPVSPDGACLLLLERDPSRGDEPRWGTVGGAIEPAEEPAEAAVRELFEETGLMVDAEQLAEPFHVQETAFTFGGVDYAGQATVFALAVPRSTEVSFEHLAPEEVGNVLEARWLTPQEATADGRLVWAELPAVMAGARAALEGRR